jgi:ABC-2 type transport system permease protein
VLKDLIHKELRLNLHPGEWAFMGLAALLLIPQWLYYIAFIYVFILLMVAVQTDKANDNLTFTTLLPVRKKDIVTARTWVIAGVEVLYVLIAAACAVVRLLLYPIDNTASMNTNVAFFGSVFLMYAIFNAIFIVGSYKKPYRLLWPLLGGSLIALSAAALFDTIALVVPAVSRLINDNGLGHLPYQLAVLAVGFAAFVGATFWANKRAVAVFETVDL